MTWFVEKNKSRRCSRCHKVRVVQEAFEERMGKMEKTGIFVCESCLKILIEKDIRLYHGDHN